MFETQTMHFRRNAFFLSCLLENTASGRPQEGHVLLLAFTAAVELVPSMGDVKFGSIDAWKN